MQLLKYGDFKSDLDILDINVALDTWGMIARGDRYLD